MIPIKETNYEFPLVGFLCRICFSKLKLVESNKNDLIFECKHCSYDGRISISHQTREKVTWMNIKF